MATAKQKAKGATPVKVERKKYSMRGDLHEKLKFVAAATNVKLMDLIDLIAEREISSWEKTHQVRIEDLNQRR